MSFISTIIDYVTWFAADVPKAGYREEQGTSQALAQKFQAQGVKVGVMIAGNAGRPGGALGRIDASGLSQPWETLKKKDYKTQEESVLIDWLKASEKEAKVAGAGFEPDAFFKDRLGTPQTWGMLDKGTGARGVETIQGFDYTLPLVKANDLRAYDFAPLVEDEVLMAPDGSSVPVELVFVFGPNVAAEFDKGTYATMKRTKVRDYTFTDNYMAFEKAVKTALRAGMKAMQKAGCQVGVLARVSGGIYSGDGRTHKRINLAYRTIVEEIMAENRELQNMLFIMPMPQQAQPKKASSTPAAAAAGNCPTITRPLPGNFSETSMFNFLRFNFLNQI